MKRPRSYGEDLDEDWGRREQDLERPHAHRRFYPKSDGGRKGPYEDERDSSRSSRKRFEHEPDGFVDRRKSFDRYRDCSDRTVPISLSSPRSVYSSSERIRRSESFSTSRREFPKGFRSERDRPRRDESVSGWRRTLIGRDVDEDSRGFGGSSGRGFQSGSEDRGSTRSPVGSRDVGKSPPWSKDSSSERSKSVELKKGGETHGESRSSSMEEGELEPDPDPSLEPETESKRADGVEPSECSDGSERELVKDVKSMDEEKLEIDQKGNCDEKQDRLMESATDAVTGNFKLLIHEEDDAVNELGRKEETVGANEGEDKEKTADEKHDFDHAEELGGKDEGVEDSVSEESVDDERTPSPPPHDNGISSNGRQEEINEKMGIERKCTMEIQNKEEKGINLEVEAEGNDRSPVCKEIGEDNNTPDVTLRFLADKLNDHGKDKGKNIAASPSHGGNSSEDGGWMERQWLVGREDAMEGPSTRGFELFFHSDATRAEKATQPVVHTSGDLKLKMEPLDLSLGLPNVSVAIDSHNAKQPSNSNHHAPHSPSHGRSARSNSRAPHSPSHGRSIQSLPTTFRTNSDGFTASISFSGSQQLVHYPSCSLTQNSIENCEHSVGSHPIFQAVDQEPQGSNWQGQSLNEVKRKEVPLFQRMLQKGNGSLHASQALQCIVDGHPVQGQYLKVSEGSNGTPNCLGRQLSLPRQLSGQLRHDEVRSPSHSVGSREIKSERSMDKKRFTREQNDGSLFRTGEREIDQLLLSDISVVARIVAQIVSESIHIVARRMQEMTEQSIAYLKESVCEVIEKEEKQGQLRALQEVLGRRDDLTLETLSNCHRAQLEILVALKTGLRDFIWRTNNIPSSDLVEIFLNLKCRNLACQSILPVDECDCKVCVKKNGFCSACMCLVCSKFDMASNTCSWVGCDVCVHWCHTDCGLRDSHIRNGQSATGAQGATEIQFHCVACGHPSEMFGFVKDVFKTCAKDWKAETLSKELEYVKRIFCASDDVRGKKMHDLAAQMLDKLEKGSSATEVCNRIMAFLTESESKFGDNPSTSSAKELPQKNTVEGSNGIVSAGLDTMWLRATSAEKAPPIDNAGGVLSSLDWDKVARQTEVAKLQLNFEKKPVVDELESIVRIKQAEAKMFQARADDARREAEGLKRIAVAKNEKIEEEYTRQITKLRLGEAEERRRQKLEELHALDKVHREYSNMKMRMEADIKDLLLKAETTKRNFSM